MSKLTADRARELLIYEPETGLLRWRITVGSRARAGAIAGNVGKSGYVDIRIDKKLYRAHRVIWLMEHGEWPHQVDHKHRTRDDNRFGELRETCDALNRQNVEVARKDSTTGLKGVHVDRRRPGRFSAVIKVGGKHFWLGTYPTAEQAHARYLDAKAQLHPAWVPSPEATNLIRETDNHLLNANGKRRVRSDSRTGLIGVYPYGDKWRARFKRKHLGTFDTPDLASLAVSLATEALLADRRANCR